MAMTSGFDFSLKSQRLIAQPALNHFFQTNKRAAADEKNVRRIDREEFLMRVLSSALRWHIGNRSFENLQQCLLHALARNVTSDRRVLVFATDLVDFVNIDNALLRAFDVAICRLQQFEDDVFYVFTDVAGFRKRSGIDDCEGDTEHARERLREQSFTGSGWSNQQNVRFLNLNV